MMNLAIAFGHVGSYIIACYSLGYCTAPEYVAHRAAGLREAGLRDLYPSNMPYLGSLDA